MAAGMIKYDGMLHTWTSTATGE